MKRKWRLELVIGGNTSDYPAHNEDMQVLRAWRVRCFPTFENLRRALHYGRITFPQVSILSRLMWQATYRSASGKQCPVMRFPFLVENVWTQGSWTGLHPEYDNGDTE